MPRGRKSTKDLSNNERIAQLNEQIEQCKERLAKLKSQRDELIAQNEIVEINELLKSTGKTAAEIKAMLQGK